MSAAACRCHCTGSRCPGRRCIQRRLVAHRSHHQRAGAEPAGTRAARGFIVVSFPSVEALPKCSHHLRTWTSGLAGCQTSCNPALQSTSALPGSCHQMQHLASEMAQTSSTHCHQMQHLASEMAQTSSTQHNTAFTCTCSLQEVNAYQVVTVWVAEGTTPCLQQRNAEKDTPEESPISTRASTDGCPAERDGGTWNLAPLHGHVCLHFSRPGG